MLNAADNVGEKAATPAPTISVPEDTAAFVAVPLVALNCKEPTKACHAAVVIPITAL